MLSPIDRPWCAKNFLTNSKHENIDIHCKLRYAKVTIITVSLCTECVCARVILNTVTVDRSWSRQRLSPFVQHRSVVAIFPKSASNYLAISHNAGAIHKEEEDLHWTVANLLQVNIHSRAALDTWKCQLEEMMLFANTICFAMFCISCLREIYVLMFVLTAWRTRARSNCILY